MKSLKKKEITKGKHKKIFCGPSKVFENFSWPINICLKYFMVPTKALLPVTYLVYGALKKDQEKNKSSAKSTDNDLL